VMRSRSLIAQGSSARRERTSSGVVALTTRSTSEVPSSGPPRTTNPSFAREFMNEAWGAHPPGSPGVGNPARPGLVYESPQRAAASLPPILPVHAPASASAPWCDTEDRKCRGDPLELRKRRILVHGHVRPRSRCSLQVSLQDGCALVGGHLVELDLLTGAAPENRSSTGCTYIADPLHVVSEHRHQVPLSFDDRDDDRQREGSSRRSSGHFQCHEEVGRHARRGHGSRRSVENSRDPVLSPPTVQPSTEAAEGHVRR
jgi:hypothetical protein